MSVAIENLPIGRGESLILKLDQSAERSLAIFVNRNGVSLMSGPLNENCAWWKFSIEGWFGITEQEFNWLLNAPAEKPF